MTDDNGWAEYRIYITKTLEANARHNENMMARLDDIQTDIITLRTKASFAGAIAGFFVSATVTILVNVLIKHLGL